MKEFSQEQRNAAYALNLCTVSVSQIIDFNDINIMDQEYEAILNNLNLERFPKDEALLETIKKILDTITFFKIQNSKKELIEKEYRHRMKNAIWSAVPNLGLLVAGGNPVTMAVSLASQIGIGYMNYRKTKANNTLSKERELLELEWTAMEQLNGLRRELFDTAWRLADKYNYPDELRLTERQIRQYNEVLMDTNKLRRYDRFDAVKDNYAAYPPFWYQFGSTANEIARDKTIELSDETRERYYKKAREFFEEYWKVNNSPLLREDQLAAACALEYVDILIESREDKAGIIDYIKKAISNSGNSCDVLQICAIAYLRLGETGEAAPLLRYLVNEEYNASVNAQILSGIYINRFMNGFSAARGDYEILRERVSNAGYLMPWPEDNVALEDKFIASQRSLLERKYQIVLDALQDKYVIAFNRLIPAPSTAKDYNDSFFTDVQEANRIEQVRSVMAVSEKQGEYLYELRKVDFEFKYIDTFNELLSALESVSSVTDMARITEMASSKIKEDADVLNQLQTKMQKEDFTIEDYIRVQGFTSGNYIKDLFEEALRQIKETVQKMSDMEEFAREESNLATLCSNQQIPDPDVLVNGMKKADELVGGERLYISYGILGDDAEDRSRKLDKLRRMKEIVAKKAKAAVTPGGSVKLIQPEDEQFADYFNKRNEDIKQYKSDVIAVLHDSGFFASVDLILFATGLLYIEGGRIQEVRTYESVKYEDPETGLKIGSKDYKNKNVDLKLLYEAIVELNRVVVER